MSGDARTARDLAGTSLRDLTTRYLDLLDNSVRVRLDGQTVVTSQALERLAVSEAISRHVHNGRQVDILAALNAGATWRDVADVLDAPENQLRGDLRAWMRSQRELYDAFQLEKPGSRPIGLSPAHADAVLRLAADAGDLDRGHSRE
jgi:flagellar biosynthesis regulator FlaF